MMTDTKSIFRLGILALVFCASAARAGGDGPAKLVPFPEDEAAAATPAEPSKPKPEFRPRFRSPNVIQAQHLEPAAEQAAEQPAESTQAESEPAASAQAKPVENILKPAEKPAAPAIVESAEPQPAPEAAPGPQLLPQAPGAEGKSAVDDAFARSKTAKTEADYNAIIDLCQRGQSSGLSKSYTDYSVKLLGWAYNRRGEARAEAGREREALADFETAVRLGGAWRAFHNRGVSYAASGKIEEAMADFNKAIELNPQYPNAYYNRGELRYSQGDDQGAVADFTQALDLGAKDAATYNGRGHAFYRMKRFGDALRDYGEAIKLEPENADPLVNRGDAYSDLGQYGEAAEDYRNAVRIAPQNDRAYQAAAWLMATCPDGHYRDDALAVDAARKAIELGGETYRNLSTLAAAQASAGKFEEARATQDKAISAAPKDQVPTGEKMMSLYQRQIAFRDRPVTSFSTPEETPDDEIQQTAVGERFGLGPKPSEAERAYYEQPQPQGMYRPAPGVRQAGGTMQGQRLPPADYRGLQQAPPPGAQPQPKRARLFGPRGKI